MLLSVFSRFAFIAFFVLAGVEKARQPALSADTLLAQYEIYSK